MRVGQMMSRLMPLLALLLSGGGCYASLNAGIDTPVSELSGAKSALNASVDLGLVANVDVGQIIISNRQGYIFNADGVQARLIGGIGEFMIEQVTPDTTNGDGKGRDVRIALLMAAIQPLNGSNNGTLTTLMIGPNFKKKYPTKAGPNIGLSPSVTISRLDIGDEITWSLGLNFRALSWLNASFFGKLGSP